MPKSAHASETLALNALAWLVSQDDLLPVFLGASGVSESDLKTRAQDPVFLASILDFMLMDDAWIIAFCDSAQIGYEAPMRARAYLPGGAQINWT